MPQEKKLTHKQQRFVEQYLVHGNATRAAAEAGYSEDTANEQGARLLANVSIKEAVTAGQAQKREAAKIDADYLLREHQEIVVLAKKEKQLAAATSSLKEIANLTGLNKPQQHQILGSLNISIMGVAPNAGTGD